MREKCLRLHKCHAEIGSAIDNFKKAVATYGDALDDVGQSGSLNPSAKGCLGVMHKLRQVHKTALATFGTTHDTSGKALSTLTNALGVSLTNRNADTSSEGTIEHGFKAQSKEDLRKACTHGGVLNQAEFAEAVVKNLSNEDRLRKAITVVAGRQNPNSLGNPHFGLDRGTPTDFDNANKFKR